MTARITSLQNPRIKRAVALRASRRRQRLSRYVIDGARELGRAIAAGAELEEVFVCTKLCTSEESCQVLAAVDKLHIPRLEVSAAVFERIAYGQRAEGVLAIGVAPELSLARFDPADDATIAVIVGIEKPGNVGAVLRSADGAGLGGLIVVDAGTDLFNPHCIRASLGTIFSLPLALASSDEALGWLRGRSRRIFAARPDASLVYTDALLAGSAALVLGSEARGLPEAWSAPDIAAIRLPMRGLADSLNISAAAAVLFYEALRQRGAAAPRERPEIMAGD